MTTRIRLDWRAVAPLLAAVAAVAALAAAVGLADPARPAGRMVLGATLVVGLVALGLSIAAWVARMIHQAGGGGPARFVVLPGVGLCARSPRWYGWGPAAQALGMGALAVAVISLAHLLPGPPALIPGLAWATVVLWAAATALSAVTLARGPATLLTPDALILREPLGTRVIPWPAVSPAWPRPGGIRARVEVVRPDLVTTRGWPLGGTAVHVMDADPRFVTEAVLFYVTHAEERAGIGTAEGHRRLRDALCTAAGTVSTPDG